MSENTLQKSYENLAKDLNLKIIIHTEELKNILQLRYNEIEQTPSFINKLILTNRFENDIKLVKKIQKTDNSLDNMISNCIDKILNIDSEDSKDYYIKCFDKTHSSLNRVFLRTSFNLQTFYNYLNKTYRKRYNNLEKEVDSYSTLQEMIKSTYDQFQDETIAMNEIVRSGFIKQLTSYQNILRYDYYLSIDEKIKELKSGFVKHITHDRETINHQLAIRDELESDINALIDKYGSKLDSSNSQKLNEIKSDLIELRADIIDCKHIKLRIVTIRNSIQEIEGNILYLSKKNDVLSNMKDKTLNILQGYRPFYSDNPKSIDNTISSIEIIQDKLSEANYKSNYYKIIDSTKDLSLPASR